MSFNPRELYSARKKENFETFAPYMRYVAQSGLLLVLAFIGIVFVDQYIKLVKYTPEQFPYEIVVTLVMTALLMYTPYRTWLKPADIIYVMPKQMEMKQYFDYCRQRSYLLSLIPFIIGCVLAHILLKAYMDNYSIIMLTQLLIMKIAVFSVLYILNQLTNRALVYIFRLLILCFIVIGVYALLLDPSTILNIVSIIGILIISLYVQVKTKKFVNWQQLIADEQKKVHRTYRFLNLFVDVPQVHNATKKRSYLAQFSNAIAYKRSNTFAYLHYLTFARSEVGGIYVRNIIVGSILAYIMSSTMLWDGYAALMFVVVFMGMNAVQLTTLRQIHRHSVWQNIYPIPLESQHKQMTAMEIKLLILSSAILVIIPSIPIAWIGNWSLIFKFVIAFVVILIWRIIVMRNMVKKQLSL